MNSKMIAFIAAISCSAWASNAVATNPLEENTDQFHGSPAAPIIIGTGEVDEIAAMLNGIVNDLNALALNMIDDPAVNAALDRLLRERDAFNDLRNRRTAEV